MMSSQSDRGTSAPHRSLTPQAQVRTRSPELDASGTLVPTCHLWPTPLLACQRGMWPANRVPRTSRRRPSSGALPDSPAGHEPPASPTLIDRTPVAYPSPSSECTCARSACTLFSTRVTRAHLALILPQRLASWSGPDCAPLTHQSAAFTIAIAPRPLLRRTRARRRPPDPRG